MVLEKIDRVGCEFFGICYGNDCIVEIEFG